MLSSSRLRPLKNKASKRATADGFGVDDEKAQVPRLAVFFLIHFFVIDKVGLEVVVGPPKTVAFRRICWNIERPCFN